MQPHPDLDQSRIVVVSAPSGAGKTTLNRRLVQTHPNLQISLSLTTRKMRPGERDGVDYHFVSREEFKGHVEGAEMLEWAEVFGNLYGTSVETVRSIQRAGRGALLEIDVQGWRMARRRIPDALSVFIIPPDVDTLWSRLRGRGTESKDSLLRRITAARDEIASGFIYQWFIVNDDLESAYEQLETIIVARKPGRLGYADGVRRCEALLRQFDAAPWLKELRDQASQS